MKPSIPKGTRDFLPSELAKRNYIFACIEKVFKKYGFVGIQTPTMENLSTLSGKYGEEGDKLLFKVLNNGDFLSKADASLLAAKESNKVLPSISKQGLRYDLTVPFARYVVMNQNELYFPFKRFQIQPVWRADRPQKGRYREFYQCDADVVGSDALIYEAELIQIFNEVYRELGIASTIKLNNRKILFGLAEVVGQEDKFVDITTSIDKLDKIGKEKVTEELIRRGVKEESAAKIMEILEVKTIDELEPLMQESPSGKKGIEEIRAVAALLEGHPLGQYEFDISLARGLNYYTGCIMEAKAKDVEIGSIGGGGRYDDLTSMFGMKDMSGVGISFGAARMYIVMEELNLFPDHIDQDVQIQISVMDTENLSFGFQILTKLRAAGISVDMYPEAAKMQKQMKFADKRKIPNVIIIGEDEKASGLLSIKNLVDGSQENLKIEDIISKFTKQSHSHL
jgi:histidyl-tRNA synthetase